MNESMHHVPLEGGHSELAIPNIEIETARLVLRQFRPSDFDRYAAMVNKREVMRFIGEGCPLSRVDAWKNMAMNIGHWLLRGYGLWAVEEKQTGALIGRIGLYYPEGWPGLEVGWLLDKPYWGKGYATEGAKASVEYAFDVLNRDKLISILHSENTASIRVAERIGQRHKRTLIIGQSTVMVYAIDQTMYRALV